jgi:hypothetical protein
VLLRRLDPCEDPAAEPVTRAQVLALLLATGAAAFFWLRWKFQPMQDLGHHVGLAAVTSDWGRPGSIYTAPTRPSTTRPTRCSGRWPGSSGD